MVDAKEYFDEVNRRFDALSDEEFMEMLIEAGLNNCPIIENERVV